MAGYICGFGFLGLGVRRPQNATNMLASLKLGNGLLGTQSQASVSLEYVPTSPAPTQNKRARCRAYCNGSDQGYVALTHLGRG